MNFGDSSHKIVKMSDCFRLFGPKRAPLSRNRVNGQDFVSFFIQYGLNQRQKNSLNTSETYTMTLSRSQFHHPRLSVLPSAQKRHFSISLYSQLQTQHKYGTDLGEDELGIMNFTSGLYPSSFVCYHSLEVPAQVVFFNQDEYLSYL